MSDFYPILIIIIFTLAMWGWLSLCDQLMEQ